MRTMQWVAVTTVSAMILTAGAARAQTAGDVTWSGGGAGVPEWDVSANWLGGQAPANPTPGIVYFSTNGQAVVGMVETDRQINRLMTLASMYGQAMSHTIDLGDKVLTVTNRLDVQGSANVARHIVFTNGTVRLSDGATLYVHMCNLTVRTNTVLDAQNLTLFRVSSSLSRDTIMNLRNADLENRVLKTRTLYVGGNREKWAQLHLNAATGVDRFEITHAFTLGDGFQDARNTYIGLPPPGGTLFLIR